MEAGESSQARAWLFEETAGRQGTGANVIPGGREGTSLSKSGCALNGKKMREEGISIGLIQVHGFNCLPLADNS